MNGLVPAWAVMTLLVSAVVAANLPFVNNRVFVLGPRKEPKPTTWHLVELVAYVAITCVLGRWLEGHIGQATAQRWEFYATTVALFVTLAFPGFVFPFNFLNSARISSSNFSINFSS